MLSMLLPFTALSTSRQTETSPHKTAARPGDRGRVGRGSAQAARQLPSTFRPHAPGSRVAPALARRPYPALFMEAPLATERYMCYGWVMRKTITQRELRNDSGAVLREVQAGQTLVVTRNGVPVAELRPVPPRRFVPRTVIAAAALRAPRVDATRFPADLDT